MVHFFGIFEPGNTSTTAATEAPHKSSFFGGAVPAERDAAQLSRAERDALVLRGPGGFDDIIEDHDIIRAATSLYI